MKLSLESTASHYVVASYAPGQIVVNQEVFTSSLVIMPTLLVRDWPPQTFTELAAEHFALLARHPITVLLLGTGEKLQFPRRELVRPLEERGIGVEVMDTGAACRTYGVLASEGRQVAAALLIPNYLSRK